MFINHSLGYESEEVSENYLKYRPKYNQGLYETILKYLDNGSEPKSTRRSLAIDVGCGTGQSTVPLAKYFRNVIGIDSSESQIQLARSNSSAEHCGGIVYHVCSAEDMSPIAANESADLVTVGVALHWFDMDRFARECRRVLKPGGLLAAYFYDVPLMNNELANEYFNQTLSECLIPYLCERGEAGFFGCQAKDSPLQQYFHEFIWDDTVYLKFSYSIGELIGFMKATPQYFLYKKDHPEHPDGIDKLIQKLKDIYGTESVDRKVDECSFPITLVAGRKA